MVPATSSQGRYFAFIFFLFFLYLLFFFFFVLYYFFMFIFLFLLFFIFYFFFEQQRSHRPAHPGSVCSSTSSSAERRGVDADSGEELGGNDSATPLRLVDSPGRVVSSPIRGRAARATRGLDARESNGDRAQAPTRGEGSGRRRGRYVHEPPSVRGFPGPPATDAVARPGVEVVDGGLWPANRHGRQIGQGPVVTSRATTAARAAGGHRQRSRRAARGRGSLSSRQLWFASRSRESRGCPLSTVQGLVVGLLDEPRAPSSSDPSRREARR